MRRQKLTEGSTLDALRKSKQLAIANLNRIKTEKARLKAKHKRIMLKRAQDRLAKENKKAILRLNRDIKIGEEKGKRLVEIAQKKREMSHKQHNLDNIKQQYSDFMADEKQAKIDAELSDMFDSSPSPKQASPTLQDMFDSSPSPKSKERSARGMTRRRRTRRRGARRRGARRRGTRRSMYKRRKSYKKSKN